MRCQCKTVCDCNAECQKASWKEHKKVCSEFWGGSWRGIVSGSGRCITQARAAAAESGGSRGGGSARDGGTSDLELGGAS
mmetsp:Transcript_28215/g.67793  ORF Transcript_28215/g.67793 Transcript_28215/m.67793 type:complete len:80 (+) Transcript_28215:68-307(+)